MLSPKTTSPQVGRRLSDLMSHETAIIEALRSYLRGVDAVGCHSDRFISLFGGILGPEILAAINAYALCLKNAPAKAPRVEEICSAVNDGDDAAYVSLREELVLATLVAIERTHFALAQHLVSNQVAEPGAGVALRRASRLALLLGCANCPCGQRMTPANSPDDVPLPAPPAVIRLAKPLAGPGTVVSFPVLQGVAETQVHERSR